jgi:hypothetical protein
MATPPNSSISSKSRGLSLFDRQAQLHADDPDKSSSQNTFFTSQPLPPLRMSQSASSTIVSTSSITQPYQAYSPVVMHRRSPSALAESYAHFDDNNVQLISVHSRPESDYIKELPPRVPISPKLTTQLLETDFPLYPDDNTEPENLTPSDLLCTAIIDKAFDYLTTPDDDDDDDVVHPEDSNEQEYDSDSFDDENDELETTTNVRNHKRDSKFSTLILLYLDV